MQESTKGSQLVSDVSTGEMPSNMNSARFPGEDLPKSFVSKKQMAGARRRSQKCGVNTQNDEEKK